MQDGLNEEQKEILRQVEMATPRVLKLPEPGRSQSLLCLAYEYFLQDMEEKAFKLLEQADPSYFKDQLSVDMKNDSRMTDIVMKILGKLMEAGYVKVSSNVEEKR